MLGARTKYRWEVPIANVDTGEAATETVESYWSPDHDTTREGIMDCARSQARARSGFKAKFMPTSDPKLLA